MALALAPVAAMAATTTSAIGAEAPKQASIEASSQRVTFGERVTLSGLFPGAKQAPVEIHQRAQGSASWRLAARTRTGAGGSWSVRVAPRQNGRWRAELAAVPQPQSVADGGSEGADAVAAAADQGTGAERIRVRSRTEAGVAGRHARVGRAVHVRGEVSPAGAKRRVVVRVGDEEIPTTAGPGGEFDVAWRAPSTGVYPVRVSARGNRVATGSRDSAGRVTVYRPAAASWYGPGLYGNSTACGQTLTPSTVGVAHKTMSCGTKLRLRYRNRTVAVRVIDRGPFAGNREFDLTSATKQALGFPDTGTVLSSK